METAVPEPIASSNAFGLVKWACILIWAVALPSFLIATNVRWVTLDLSTYTTGFARLRTVERTGIPAPELERIGREFIEFFKGHRAEMQVHTELPTGPRALFNEREVTHMEDVRGLMTLLFRAQPIAGWALVGTVVLMVALLRGGVAPTVQTMIYSGAGTTLALGLLVAALSLMDFTALFIQFHQLSFSNDLWQLDPRTDYLLILFPEQFWLDTTMRIAWMTVLEVLALAGLGWLLPRALAS